LSNLVHAQKDCFPIQPGCTKFVDFNTEIEIPRYPGCKFRADYKLRICQGVAQIGTIEFGIANGGDPNCSTFISELSNEFFNGTPASLIIFLTSLYSSVETEVANDYFNQTIAGTPPDYWNCSNPNRKIASASFYRGACVTFCIAQTAEGQLRISTGVCSSACCVKSMTCCVNDLGQKVITESSTLVPGSACANIPPSNSCPEGTLFQSPCFELCK
jgi:hypothetical protein